MATTGDAAGYTQGIGVTLAGGAFLAVGEYTHGSNSAAGRRGYAVNLQPVRRGADQTATTPHSAPGVFTGG